MWTSIVFLGFLIFGWATNGWTVDLVVVSLYGLESSSLGTGYWVGSWCDLSYLGVSHPSYFEIGWLQPPSPLPPFNPNNNNNNPPSRLLDSPSDWDHE